MSTHQLPLEPIETASRDELQALQLKRLKATLQHAYRNSPVYMPLGARMPRDRPISTRKDARSRITLRVLPVQKDLDTESNSITLSPFRNGANSSQPPHAKLSHDGTPIPRKRV